MKQLLILLMILSVGVHVRGQSLRRLLKTLEKKDYEQMEELLLKSFEKDSINAPAFYTKALLNLESDYGKASIDTAYMNILDTRNDLGLTEEKDREKYRKKGLSERNADSLKSLIEEKAFARAETHNTVESYQYFLDFFQSAEQRETAIELRNALAFAKAQEENTYEGYLRFLETYPDARQVNEAKELYDIRLFQESTSDDKLSSYKRFILEHPESPFRNEAEKQLFDRITSMNRASDYMDFLKQVDHKFFTRKALDYLYYSSRENFDTWKELDLDKGLMDSLGLACQLSGEYLIPFFEISQYGFMNRMGQTIIDKSFTRLGAEYLCEGLSNDVIIDYGEVEGRIYGRNKELIYSGELDQVEDLGMGLLEIILPGSRIIIQKGGHKILEGNWEEASIFDSSIIGIKHSRGWELYTFTGKPLLPYELDEVQLFSNLLFLKRKDKWAVVDLQEIINEHEPTFSFDEIEAEDDYFIAEEKDVFFLYDGDGRPLTAKGYENINYRYGKWIFERDNEKVMILEDSFANPLIHREFMYNAKYVLAGEKSGKWVLINHRDSLEFILSDPVFFGSQFLIAERNDSLMIYYHPDSAAIYLQGSFPELIRNAGQLMEEPTEFVLVTEGKKKSLISSEGYKINGLGRYDNFIIQGKEYVVVTRKGKKGVIDMKGEQLLAPAFDGIGNYKNSTLALLKDEKFGAFRYFPSVMILPEYDIALEEFSPNQFKARKDGLFGMINANGKVLMDFQYEDITKWTDSLALVKNNFRWKIVNIFSGNYEMEDIKDFKPMEKEGEILLKLLTGTGYGVISSVRGMIVPPVYSDLYYFYHEGEYTFFCEKNIEEASFYVVIYIDDSGNIIKKQAFEEEDYRMIYCEVN